MAVYVNGGKVEEASGLKHAADLLSKARLPVIAGLMTDIAGAQQALALARKLGGVIDHAAGGPLTRAMRIMREAGGTPVSLGELRNRADLVVLVGEDPLKSDPDLLQKLFPAEEHLPRPGDAPRALLTLGAKPRNVPDVVEATEIKLGNRDLPLAIGMLAAAIRKRPFGDASEQPAKSLLDAAERLRQAAFAVFVYSPAELEEPVLHVILDAVRTLCDSSRAGTYSVAVPGNGDGVNLCSVWTCGLPVRTRFVHVKGGHVEPEHDAWRYTAERLVETGEADALVWVEAMRGSPVKRPEGVPSIVLAHAGVADPKSADVVIEVAIPGEDHTAALYLPEIAGIGMVGSSGKGGAKGLPSVAKILAGITGRVTGREAA